MTLVRANHQETILYFSNCNNYHTKKWASFFSEAGYRIHVASLEPPMHGHAGGIDGVTVHHLKCDSKRLGPEIQKLGYLKTIDQAASLISDIDPDIVHAHYASSYGTICAAACRRPYYLSIWGNDIYDFPRKGPVHKALICHSLKRASWLMSTSEAMAKEARKYTDKKIAITPFGVDMGLFNPDKAVAHDGFWIGTVKGLEKKYGIEILLRACSILHERRPDIDLRLRIAGAGTLEGYLREVSHSLDMDDYVDWLGFISQERAACEWASFDVAVVPSESESESFGVSAVEAQAAGTPLIITDIPGLMEACNGGKTAVVVPRGDARELADAIESLANDPNRRKAMGEAGRDYVKTAYEYRNCFKKVREIYNCNESIRSHGHE